MIGEQVGKYEITELIGAGAWESSIARETRRSVATLL